MAAATTFEFRAMDLAGAASAGEIEAESKAAVGEQLRQRGLIVLDVSEKKKPVNIEDCFKHWQGVDMRELAVFSRQFATLVASGMPMLRTLQTLEEQTQDEQIKNATAATCAPTSRPAARWSRRWSGTRKVFDRLFRAMVRSGEQSGRLEEVLDRIAYQVEKADALRRQVKSALMYPALVFGFAIVVLVAIVAFVIPVFVKIFEELAEEHPEEAVGAAAPDSDLHQRLQCAHRLLVHHHPGAGRCSSSASSSGRRPNAGTTSGTGPNCRSRSRSAT